MGCGALLYLYQYVIRVSPNIMNDELMRVFSIDATTLGMIVGFYYWTYTAMQLPLGITMDRLGPRGFLCGAFFLLAAAAFLFGHTTSVPVASFARLMMGAGSACGLLASLKLGTLWLKPKHMGLAVGMTILFGTLGGAIGGAPMRLVLNHYGYQHTMEILAAVGVILGTIVLFIAKNHPEKGYAHSEENVDIYANQNPFKDILLLAKTPQAWVVAIYGMLMYVPITTIAIAWGVPFVERACDTSEAIAATVVSTMLLGAAFGSPCFAIFSDFMKNRRIPMLIGSIISTALYFVIILVEGIPLTYMYILFFIVGFAYTAKTLTFASICEIMPRKISGTSVAFVNMVVMTTGIIFHPLIGRLLDLHWNGVMDNGQPLYTEGDYRFALIAIPISLLISGFILFFMKETHPESSVAKDYGHIIDTDVL